MANLPQVRDKYVYSERRKGLIYSVLFHVLLVAFMVFGMPSIFKSKMPLEPMAVTVELLPITKISNVKPSSGTPVKKSEPKKIKKPSPPVKASPPAPPLVSPDAFPEPKPKPKKKMDKPKPKPKPKKPKPKKRKKPKKSKDDDLAAILKAVKDTAKKHEKDKSKKPKKIENDSSSSKAVSNLYDPNKMMSISERDAIMGQLARCWNPPAGAKDAHKLVVVVDAQFDRSGQYISVKISSESRRRYHSDSFFRAAADSAVRAVKQCSPLRNLSPEKYDTWRAMELHFDPRELLQ